MTDGARAPALPHVRLAATIEQAGAERARLERGADDILERAERELVGVRRAIDRALDERERVLSLLSDERTRRTGLATDAARTSEAIARAGEAWERVRRRVTGEREALAGAELRVTEAESELARGTAQLDAVAALEAEERERIARRRAGLDGAVAEARRRREEIARDLAERRERLAEMTRLAMEAELAATFASAEARQIEATLPDPAATTGADLSLAQRLRVGRLAGEERERGADEAARARIRATTARADEARLRQLELDMASRVAEHERAIGLEEALVASHPTEVAALERELAALPGRSRDREAMIRATIGRLATAVDRARGEGAAERDRLARSESDMATIEDEAKALSAESDRLRGAIADESRIRALLAELATVDAALDAAIAMRDRLEQATAEMRHARSGAAEIVRRGEVLRS